MPNVTLNDTETMTTTMIEGAVAVVPDGTITTNKVADNAVTTPKIANGAVTSDKLDSSLLMTAITNAEIDAITSS